MFVMIEDLYQHILIVSYIGLYEEDHCQKSYFTKKKKNYRVFIHIAIVGQMKGSC